MTKLKLFKQKINCSSLQPFFLNEQNKTISIPDQGLKKSTVSFFVFSIEISNRFRNLDRHHRFNEVEIEGFFNSEQIESVL